MSESFDWERKLTTSEAVDILSQEKHTREYLAAYDDSDLPDEGWEKAELTGPVKEDH